MIVQGSVSHQLTVEDDSMLLGLEETTRSDDHPHSALGWLRMHITTSSRPMNLTSHASSHTMPNM
jgi:hypothetical protein